MPRRATKTDRTRPVIVWFRYDLRLADHPALTAAADTGQPVLPVYVLDDETPGLRRLGSASRWWLDGSLRALAQDLQDRGARLHVVSGAADEVVPRLAAAAGASAVFWSRLYSAAEVALDREVEARLKQAEVEVHTFNGSLGHEPDEVTPKTGGWYKVYAAYWKAAEAAPAPEEPLPAPAVLVGAQGLSAPLGSLAIEDLGLRPAKPDWAGGLAEAWTPGESEAHRKLQAFAADRLGAYAVDRDRPASEGGSRLSPHLRFGEISPRQILAAVRSQPASLKFRQEIAWRDFCYNLLFHTADLATESFDRKFRDFAHRTSASDLKAWQRGRTGYPIVDAGMRQLWRTGWMHNRVRMITASFLVKDILADWREGERWFWDTLCDADPADNAVNWQWVAGTGPDAAPFFRIFSPVLQGEKFDPDGAYVKAFVPELARLPARWVHKPWDAPAAVLAEAGVDLGRTYPAPIVAHGVARQRALDAYAALRDAAKDAGSSR